MADFSLFNDVVKADRDDELLLVKLKQVMKEIMHGRNAATFASR